MNKYLATATWVASGYAVLSLLMYLWTWAAVESSSQLTFGLESGQWWGIFSAVFVNYSVSLLRTDLNGIWSSVILLLLLFLSGMYSYGWPSTRRTMAVLFGVPLVAAFFADMIEYTHLSPGSIGLGTSGLDYALFGLLLISSVFFMRHCVNVFQRLPSRAKIRSGRQNTLLFTSYTWTGLLALLIFAKFTDSLWDPVTFFNIQPGVGYQIHILGYVLGILGGAFVLFTARLDDGYSRILETFQ